MFSVIFSIYFLLDGRNLEHYWDKVLKTISSKRFYNGFHRIVDDTDRVFSSYIKGQLLDALILAFMVSVSLSIVGVPYGVLIGIVTGIGNLIPYVGAFVAYACTIASCLFAGDTRMLIIATILICIFQFIDGNIINPKLLSDSVEVHPLLVICCLLIGGAFGGIIGMVVSVPAGAVLKIQFERVMHHIAGKRGLSEPAGPPEDNAL
jgi:predicted PurR-regulated permease PerM